MLKIKLLPILAFVLILMGCSGGGEYTENGVMVDSLQDGGFSYDDGVESEAVGAPAESMQDDNVYADKLVYTCDIKIETLEYDESVSAIRQKIKDAGGIISYEDEWDNDHSWYQQGHVDSHDRHISITARIPSGRYESFTASLEGNGKVISRSSSVENISKRYYDTEAVIESLKIQEERLFDMMDKAQTIEEMIAVESRLTDVQTQLNRYNTNLAAMQMDVDYSTVNISLEEVYEYTREKDSNTFFNRLKNTLVDSVEGFVSTALKSFSKNK